jgi:transitional endoplasmic reticulum ATPase
MDDDIEDLMQAVTDAKSSAAVLKTLLKTAKQSPDFTAVAQFLIDLQPGNYVHEDTRLAVGDYLLEAGEAAAALKWFAGESAVSGVRRAGAHLAMGDKAEAMRQYRAAVAREPDLKDAGLETSLSVLRGANSTSAEVFDLTGKRLSSSPELINSSIVPLQPRERITFADVGGLDEVKSQINRKIVLPFAKPALFQRFRKKAGGGVLLFGPPGCGKTLIARATAGECSAKFVPIHIPEILDMYIGESEKRLATVFENARQNRPTVLFIDEIEALAARRKYSTETTQSTLVSTFLAEMDGITSSNDGVLVLAATNIPWAIDSAFRRPGRFDRVIFVPPPDEAARLVILKLHMANRPQSTSLDLKAVAAKTSGFSGADLSGLVDIAVELAIEDSIRDDNISVVTQAHFSNALKEIKPSTVEWLSSARNYAKYANESGLYDEVARFLEKHSR